MLQNPQAKHHIVIKTLKKDLFKWTPERHAGDYPLDRRLLRDGIVELAAEHQVTDFKCFERRLTCFLRRHDFSLDMEEHSGPSFSGSRVWIDTMRSIIAQYGHKDLFYLVELTIHSDISSIGISATLREDQPQDPTLKKATILMCCNASGTEKLPLLICGSYPAVIANENYMYSYSEDASRINDTLLKEWLNRVNDRMSESNRKILLLLHRNRVNAFRDLELSNVRHVFFPDAFPLLLRTSKKDVFDFVKMMHGNKYVEGIKEHGHGWNAENVVRSLMEAWQKVPRNLIIASFERTSFRTDNCFLKIHSDAWEDSKIKKSFKKFVTFDDNFSSNTSQRKSTGKSRGYNSRSKHIFALIDDHFDSTIDLKRKEWIDDYTPVNGNLEEIFLKKDIDYKKKSSLKRSYDKAQLNEDVYGEMNNAKSSNGWKDDEDTATVPTPAKLPRISAIQAMENATESSKFERTYSTRTIVDATLSTSGRNADCNCRGGGPSNKRSIESPSEAGNTSDDNIALQQVYDDTFLVEERETNAIVSYSAPSGEIQLSGLNENARPSRKSLKRRRSRLDNTEESRNNSEEDAPERKRSNSGSGWTKQCEMIFACNSSDITWTLAAISCDMLTMSGGGGGGIQWPRIRRACENERSIFTIRPRRD